jgi:S1-C subfamily serine protease/antitoxin component YwqK of YwqJK toxin-antitoxin module
MKIKKIVLIYIGVFSASFFAQSFPIDSSRFYNSKEGCKVYSLYFGEDFEFSWNGACSAGYADGQGELLILRQESEKQAGSIKGVFTNGVPTGPCVVTTPTESIIEVPFVDGRIWGKGSFTMKNGKIFKGNMVNLTKHGEGEIIYTVGDVFTGILNDNEPWIGRVLTLKKDTIYIEYGEEVKKPAKFISRTPILNKEQTEYFDADWNRCEQVNASYYRKITYASQHMALGPVRDYYINGKLFREMHLYYVDCNDVYMDLFGLGSYKSYHPNGNLRFETQVNHRGEFEGRTISYHENGNFKLIGAYSELGEEDGNWATFDEQGKLIQYRVFEDGQLVDGKYYSIDSDGRWQYNDVYKYENFEADEAFWIDYNEIGDRKFPNQILMNDRLFIPVKKGESYLRVVPMTVDKELNFGLYMDASALKSQIKKGSSFGLVFNYRSESEFYSFQVNNKDEVQLKAHKEGKETVFFSVPLEKHNKRLNKGNEAYSFAISVSPSNVYFYVNDQEITSFDNDNELGDMFGVFASGDLAFALRSIESVEFFNQEDSEDFTNFVQKKVVNYNPSEYDGNGSGFFISRQGHIVTNYHVVEETSELFTKLLINGNVEKLPLKVVAKDKVNDLAILKVDKAGFDLGKDIPYAFEYNTVDVGEEVFTLGYPMVDVMGEELKFTDGKISAKSGIDGDITTYQITTPIQSGNSGGPLFQEESGNIVGIVSSYLNRNMFNGENVNYAIKSNLLKTLIESSSDPIKINTVAPAKEMKLSDRIKLYREFMPIIFFKE